MKRKSVQKIDKKALLRELLVDKRNNAGLKQSDVSRELGKPQSYISKIELGTRRMDVVEFIEIARAIKLNPVELLKDFIKSCEDQESIREK